MIKTSFPVSSLNLLFFIKREKLEEWQEKVYTKKDTGRTKESASINVNHNLTYTVIFVIL